MSFLPFIKRDEKYIFSDILQISLNEKDTAVPKVKVIH